MALTVDQLKNACAEVRDVLTDGRKSSLVWSLGLDIIADAPLSVLLMLVDNINARMASDGK